LAVTEVLLVLSDMTSCHLYIRKFMCGDFSEQTSACGSGDLSQSTSGALVGAGYTLRGFSASNLAMLPFARIFRIT
jgi:hypothetical protein